VEDVQETLGNNAYLALHPAFMLVLCTSAAEMRIYEATAFYLDCMYNFCSDPSKVLFGMSVSACTYEWMSTHPRLFFASESAPILCNTYSVVQVIFFTV
jgi:hypothetical protein